MKKRFLTTVALAIGFSSLSALPAAIEPATVQAATVQNNNQAVALKANQLINTAKGLMGKATYSSTVYKSTAPYKFSCATFLMYVFEKNGVDLATYNEDYMIKQGTYVPRSQLQKGDLVFFKSKKTGTDPDHVGIRVLGEVTEEKLDIVREADFILREEIKNAGLERDIWQYFCVLPDIRSVGVMGDGRTYDYAIGIRGVTSIDGMTSDWARIPYDVSEKISVRIVNEVNGINRVLYDLTPKPIGTIEWE